MFKKVDSLIICFYLFFRSQGALDFPHLRSFVVREIERNEDYLGSSWYPLICQIFQMAQIQSIATTAEKTNSFYNSVNTLVSNQVSFLLHIVFPYFISIDIDA